VEDPRFLGAWRIIDVFSATESYPCGSSSGATNWRTLAVLPSLPNLSPLESVCLYAAAEEPGARPQSISSLLPVDTYVVRTDPVKAGPRVEAFQSDLSDVIGEVVEKGAYSAWEEVERDLADFPAMVLSSLGSTSVRNPSSPYRATSGEMPVTNLPEAEEAQPPRLVADGYRCVIAFEQRAEAERAVTCFAASPGRWPRGGITNREPGVSFLPAPHRRHFVKPDIKTGPAHRVPMIFPRRHKARFRRPPAGLELSSFRDLRKGTTWSME
jgi:hypothetical protein